jgi:hypothetical protein
MIAEFREWTMWLAEWAIVYILVLEYWFDKKIYESKRKKIVRTKNKVRVKVDQDGQVYVLEQPKNIDVSIEHGSKEE